MNPIYAKEMRELAEKSRKKKLNISLETILNDIGYMADHGHFDTVYFYRGLDEETLNDIIKNLKCKGYKLNLQPGKLIIKW